MNTKRIDCFSFSPLYSFLCANRWNPLRTFANLGLYSLIAKRSTGSKSELPYYTGCAGTSLSILLNPILHFSYFTLSALGVDYWAQHRACPFPLSNIAPADPFTRNKKWSCPKQRVRKIYGKRPMRITNPRLAFSDTFYLRQILDLHLVRVKVLYHRLWALPEKYDNLVNSVG